MRIGRISVVMVVFRPAVSKKERLGPVAKPTLQRSLKLIRERASIDYSFQRKQDVRAVKAVDPLLVRFGAVEPGAVGLLLINDVTGGALGFMTQRSVAGQPAHAG